MQSELHNCFIKPAIYSDILYCTNVQGVCQLNKAAKGQDRDHRRIDLR